MLCIHTGTYVVPDPTHAQFTECVPPLQVLVQKFGTAWTRECTKIPICEVGH